MKTTVVTGANDNLAAPVRFPNGEDLWTVEEDSTILGIAFELRHRYTGELYFRYERRALTLHDRFRAIASGLERLWIFQESYTHLQHPAVRMVPIRRNYRWRVIPHP